MAIDYHHCSDCGLNSHCCSFYDCFNWMCDECSDRNVDRLAAVQSFPRKDTLLSRMHCVHRRTADLIL